MKTIATYKRLNKNNKMFTTINVTPLTDIALTLLVVFMVATPMMMQSNINVNLPQVEKSADVSSDEVLTIIIDEKGHIFIDEVPISIKVLKNRIQDYASKNKNKSVIINADKTVKYDSVVKVLDIVKSEGITKISLGVEVEKA